MKDITLVKYFFLRYILLFSPFFINFHGKSRNPFDMVAGFVGITELGHFYQAKENGPCQERTFECIGGAVGKIVHIGFHFTAKRDNRTIRAKSINQLKDADNFAGTRFQRNGQNRPCVIIRAIIDAFIELEREVFRQVVGFGNI